MSDNVPYDIQLNIMKRLPVKSLLQYRSVLKLWKYSIDCMDFVRAYGFREASNCSLYLTFKHNFEGFICSVDDNLALSPVVSNLNFSILTPFATCEGVWCFSYQQNSMLLIWNPSIKKSVPVMVINYLLEPDSPKMLFGFGVHPVTLDLTILKINYPYYGDGPWYVSVFTLSSNSWYKLQNHCLPRESIQIKRSGQAVVGDQIFWVASEKFYGYDGISYKNYMLVSFDLLNHQFQVIELPEEMLSGPYLPPYYISSHGDCIIISGSFDGVQFRILYVWELQVEQGDVSWYNQLFNFRSPMDRCLKLIEFNKDKQALIEVSFYHEPNQSLHVYNPTFQYFHNLLTESDRGTIFIAPYKKSLILLHV